MRLNFLVKFKLAQVAGGRYDAEEDINVVREKVHGERVYIGRRECLDGQRRHGVETGEVDGCRDEWAADDANEAAGGALQAGEVGKLHTAEGAAATTTASLQCESVEGGVGSEERDQSTMGKVGHEDTQVGELQTIQECDGRTGGKMQEEALDVRCEPEGGANGLSGVARVRREHDTKILHNAANVRVVCP